jgi:hypothetical protein
MLWRLSFSGYQPYGYAIDIHPIGQLALKHRELTFSLASNGTALLK